MSTSTGTGSDKRPTGPGPDPHADPATVEVPRDQETENIPALSSSPGAREWVGRPVHGRTGGTFGRLTDVVTGPDGTAWGVVRPRMGGARAIPLDGAVPDDAGVTVPIDRRTLRAAPAGADPGPELAHHYASRGALTAAHEYQHERFGGLKIGSAFFGWLVAVGLTVLLAAVAALVVRLAGVSPDLTATAGQDPRLLGLTGGIVAVVVMLLAYVAGGYVAGRLARFDGARNGFAVWAMGLVVTAAVTIATAATGSTDSIFAALRVPGIAVSVGDWPNLVALVVVAAVALLGALVGGKAGERYHRRVDRAAEQAL
ncbi:hypothetical protein [Pseudonocardia sp. WMMC193]|uniref:hypothetical protein n=1 Tax=Pseudonocardia sp. WMMC193 TaxID=2911965 RepID=UPI001F2E504E|nr:hypothetical protein [Pseudonocardia sp. WMMC193]MCF7547769.1 hypothetical protein [Pseudonocardia sp. WMMC193]